MEEDDMDICTSIVIHFLYCMCTCVHERVQYYIQCMCMCHVLCSR